MDKKGELTLQEMIQASRDERTAAGLLPDPVSAEVMKKDPDILIKDPDRKNYESDSIRKAPEIQAAGGDIKPVEKNMKKWKLVLLQISCE